MVGKNGFRLVAEKILEENGKLYEILVAESGQMRLSEVEHRFGPYLLEEASPVFVKKWRRELEKLSFALEQVPSERQGDRFAISQKSNKFRRYSMLASQVIERYQAFCPSSLAMEGDVKGQIGTLNKEIQRVMVALDIRETTVAEAIDKRWI